LGTRTVIGWNWPPTTVDRSRTRSLAAAGSRPGRSPGSMKRPEQAGYRPGYGPSGGRVKRPSTSLRRPAGPTRRLTSLLRRRSCGKSRKVVSVPGARLGITESPGDYSALRVEQCGPSLSHRLSTPVDNYCGRPTGAA
jgi:hypothetical protein